MRSLPLRSCAFIALALASLARAQSVLPPDPIRLDSAAVWLGPVLFVLYVSRFQILPEERALQAKFGESYAAYRRRTRRWL